MKSGNGRSGTTKEEEEIKEAKESKATNGHKRKESDLEKELGKKRSKEKHFAVVVVDLEF